MRTVLASAGALLLLSTVAAPARPMHVMSSTPAAEAIMQGDHAGYVVRFDGPVDHAQSQLEILRDGQVVESLHPRLNSEPNVLFAAAPALPAGHYTLHWTVRSMPDQEISDGTIPFSVSQ
jgi:methionine-rich copper-binding protein CopC